MNYRFLLVQISWGDYRQTLSLKNIARVDSHKLKVTAETQTALSRLIELLLTNLNIVTLLLAHFSKPLASCSSLDNETDAWTMRHFLFIPACTVHDCKNRSVWWSGHPSLSESVHDFFGIFFLPNNSSRKPSLPPLILAAATTFLGLLLSLKHIAIMNMQCQTKRAKKEHGTNYHAL